MSEYLKMSTIELNGTCIDIVHNTDSRVVVASASSSTYFRESPRLYVKDFNSLEAAVSAAVGYVLIPSAGEPVYKIVNKLQP